MHTARALKQSSQWSWLRARIAALLHVAVSLQTFACAARMARVTEPEAELLAPETEAGLALRASRIAAGDGYSCAVTGSKRALVCWGSIEVDDQVAHIAPRASSSEVTQVARERAAQAAPTPLWWAPERDELHIDAHGTARPTRGWLRPLQAVKQVVIKRGVGCALLVDGEAACFRVRSRALGAPRTRSSTQALATVSLAEPSLRTSLRGASRIASDGRAFCGLRAGRAERCAYGSPIVETLRSLNDIADFAGDASHSCVLGNSGELQCWGDNERGQLGVPDRGLDRCITQNGILPCSEQPRAVPLLRPAKQLAVGAVDCAVLDDGTMQCWGGERVGSRWLDAKLPRRVRELEHVVQVALQGSQGCALDRRGKVHCFHQLHFESDGRSISLAATLVAGIDDAREIAVGRAHGCAVRSDRSVWCWDNGERGPLEPKRILAPHSVSPPIMELDGGRDLIGTREGSSLGHRQHD